jgi:hypothetical protein
MALPTDPQSQQRVLAVELSTVIVSREVLANTARLTACQAVDRLAGGTGGELLFHPDNKIKY